MDITLQYFDGCPNWKVTDRHLRTLIAAEGLDLTVRHQRVETQEVAAALGFRGSPTVLIDGIDPFAEADVPVGLSCRVYPTEDGLAGSPSRDQLRAAIAAARARG